MKKQLRNIIISLCVVVVLVAGVVIWTKVVTPTVKTSSSSGTSSSSTPAIQVFKTNEKDVTTLKVTNKSGGYTITRQGSSYAINGISTSLLNQDLLTTTVKEAADIAAMSLVEKGSSNLKQFGLDKPQAVLEVTSGGKTTAINIGGNTPSQDGNYFNVQGSTDVYKAGTTFIAAFSGKNIDFVNMALSSVDSSALSSVSRMELGGTARSTPIVLEEVSTTSTASSQASETPAYKMIKPRSYQVNTDKSSAILQAIQSLSASSVITVDCSSANLAKYGLKNPEYTFAATIKGKQVKLNFGTPFKDGDTEYLPVMLEGRAVIYKIASSSVSFYNYKLTDVCSSLLFTENIDTVKSVTVSKGSESYTVNFSGTGDKLVATYNGKTMVTKNARKFYESIVGISTEGTATKPANGSVYAKIVVTYRSSKAPTTMEFITLDSRKCFWSIDGQGDFYILRDLIDKAVSTTKDFAAGKTLPD